MIDPERAAKAEAGDDDDDTEEEGVAKFGVDDDDDDHEIRMVIESLDKKSSYAIRLDALLVGHEDWVTGLQWHPPIQGPKGGIRPLALLSCSMDRSLIIWRPEGPAGIWTPSVRLGDLGADIGGAVGSNLLGFLGCVFNNEGEWS